MYEILFFTIYKSHLYLFKILQLLKKSALQYVQTNFQTDKIWTWELSMFLLLSGHGQHVDIRVRCRGQHFAAENCEEVSPDRGVDLPVSVKRHHVPTARWKGALPRAHPPNLHNSAHNLIYSVHPDTTVLSSQSKLFQAVDLKFTPIEPMRKWRITFNGTLRKGVANEWRLEQDETTLVHVRFNFM